MKANVILTYIDGDEVASLPFVLFDEYKEDNLFELYH